MYKACLSTALPMRLITGFLCTDVPDWFSQGAIPRRETSCFTLLYRLMSPASPINDAELTLPMPSMLRSSSAVSLNPAIVYVFLYRFVYLAYLLFQMGYEFLYALYDRMRMAAAGSEFLKPVIFSFPQRYKLGASPCKFSQQTFRQARGLPRRDLSCRNH